MQLEFSKRGGTEAHPRSELGNFELGCPFCSAVGLFLTGLQDTNGQSLNFHHFQINSCGLFACFGGQTINVTEE